VLGIDVAEGMIATAREACGSARPRARRVPHRGRDDDGPAGGELRRRLGRWSLIYVADPPAALARLRGALVAGGRIALSAWAPPEANPWITIPMAALAKVRTLPPTDPAVPGAFHLSQDGALAKALVGAGYQAVGQERVVLSWFAHDPDEFWAVTGDTAGPLASLLADLSGGGTGAGEARSDGGDREVPRRRRLPHPRAGPARVGAGVGSRAAALQRTWPRLPRVLAERTLARQTYRCSW